MRRATAAAAPDAGAPLVDEGEGPVQRGQLGVDAAPVVAGGVVPPRARAAGSTRVSTRRPTACLRPVVLRRMRSWPSPATCRTGSPVTGVRPDAVHAAAEASRSSAQRRADVLLGEGAGLAVEAGVGVGVAGPEGQQVLGVVGRCAAVLVQVEHHVRAVVAQHGRQGPASAVRRARWSRLTSMPSALPRFRRRGRRGWRSARRAGWSGRGSAGCRGPGRRRGRGWW